MELIDFNGRKTAPKWYGGENGRKICIVDDDGARWMVKFPESTAGLGGNIASYTTSPVSEWLGSHVYESLGVPVHETKLGFREGKVVVACRDFTYPSATLIDFHNLKNAIPDESPGNFEKRPSDGRSTTLSDVLSAIEVLDLPVSRDEFRDRFWDMFVVDAFIGNADRNNGNWGILQHPGDVFEMAPVFDSGNAFFNKRRESRLEDRLNDEVSLLNDANLSQSCFTESESRDADEDRKPSSASRAPEAEKRERRR